MWLNYPGISITQPPRPDSGEPRNSQVTCICQVHELCHFAIDPHRPGGRSTNVFPPFLEKVPQGVVSLWGHLQLSLLRSGKQKHNPASVCMKHTAYLDLLLTYLKFETVNSHKQKGFRYL